MVFLIPSCVSAKADDERIGMDVSPCFIQTVVLAYHSGIYWDIAGIRKKNDEMILCDVRGVIETLP